MNLLIRDVPPDVHATLRARAKSSGMSLQAYLADQLVRLASRPTVDEVLDDIASNHSGGRLGLDTAVNALDQERRTRDRDLDRDDDAP